MVRGAPVGRRMRFTSRLQHARVFSLNVFPNPSAHFGATLGMVDALARAGWSVTLHAHFIADEMQARASSMGMDARIRFGWSARPHGRFQKLLTLVVWILTLLARRDGLVLTRSPTLALLACRAERVVLEIHQRRRSPIFGLDALWPLRFVRRRGLRVACISANLAESVRRDFPVLPRDTVVVVPSGFWAAWFSDTRRPAPGKPRVGYAGSLYPGRGAERVIYLARAFADVEFEVVGGPTTSWESLTRSLVTPTNLHYRGPIPHEDVPHFLASCTVLLAPYQHAVLIGNGEDTSAWASPLKIPEYLAAGRAILASRVPMVQQLLVDGRNARLVDPDDAESWVLALRQILSDQELCEQLGRAAHATAFPALTWDKRIDRILNSSTVSGAA